MADSPRDPDAPIEAQAESPAGGTRRRAPALQVLGIRDFRLLWLNNALMIGGSQIRMMGQAWVTLDLTDNSSLWVGIVNGAPAISMFFLAIYGGVVADRADRRAILLWIKPVVAALAFLTAYLVTSGHIEVWHLVVIGLVAGAVFAFGAPAGQTFVVDIVGRDRAMTAVSLNMTISNVALIVGPSIGGAILATAGSGAMFWILGGLYAASFGAVALIRRRPRPEPAKHRPGFADLVDGLRYVMRTPHVRWLMFLGLAAILPGMLPALIPIYAKTILNVGEIGYGVLLAAEGAGALAGAIVLAMLGEVKQKGLLLFIAVVVLSVSMAVFGVSRSYALSIVAVAGFGIIGTVWMATAGTVVLTSVDPAVRGRVTGVFQMVTQTFLFGWFVGGALAEWIGPTTTLVSVAAINLVFVITAFARSPELRRLS